MTSKNISDGRQLEYVILIWAFEKVKTFIQAPDSQLCTHSNGLLKTCAVRRGGSVKVAVWTVRTYGLVQVRDQLVKSLKLINHMIKVIRKTSLIPMCAVNCPIELFDRINELDHPKGYDEEVHDSRLR